MTPFEKSVLKFLMQITADVNDLKAAVAVLIAAEEMRLTENRRMSRKKAAALMDKALAEARKAQCEEVKRSLDEFSEALEEAADIKELFDRLDRSSSKPS